jgi:DNA sulfur modification protein DndC
VGIHDAFSLGCSQYFTTSCPGAYYFCRDRPGAVLTVLPLLSSTAVTSWGPQGVDTHVVAKFSTVTPRGTGIAAESTSGGSTDGTAPAGVGGGLGPGGCSIRPSSKQAGGRSFAGNSKRSCCPSGRSSGIDDAGPIHDQIPRPLRAIVLDLRHELKGALLGINRRESPVTVLYCDTGVEIPVVAHLVRRTLRQLSREAKAASLPLRVRIARPRAEDSFFVKVIGRGYPPPTNKFRWCTDRLRIVPVQREIARISGREALVLLGVIHGESPERDRTLEGLKTERPFMLLQRGSARTTVFAPLLNYSTKDVWDTLALVPWPKAVDTDELATLYRQASGECPIIRDPQGTPCGKGRFGCWTCTVVRKDRGLTGLVEGGYAHLEPLLEFRNWLQEIRDQPAYRCLLRRNGARGPGPLTLGARRLILRRLRSVERRAGIRLITDKELRLVRLLWEADKDSASYRHIERGSSQAARITRGCSAS